MSATIKTMILCTNNVYEIKFKKDKSKYIVFITHITNDMAPIRGLFEAKGVKPEQTRLQLIVFCTNDISTVRWVTPHNLYSFLKENAPMLINKVCTGSNPICTQLSMVDYKFGIDNDIELSDAIIKMAMGGFHGNPPARNNRKAIHYRKYKGV